MERLAGILIRFRFVAAATLVVLLVLSFRVIPDIRLDLSIGRLIEASQEKRDEVDMFHQELPWKPFDVLCSVAWDRPLDAAALDRLAAIEAGLTALPEVHSTRSLATTFVMPATGLPIPRPFPATVGDRPVHEAALSHTLFRRRLVSADGRAAMVAVVTDPRVDRSRFLEVVEERLPELAGDDATVRIHGNVKVERSMKGYMRADVVRTLLLETLLFAILLPLLFRSARGVFIPLLAVWCGVVFDIALMSVLGMTVTIIDVAVPGLVLVIGMCDSIHMLHRFEEAFAEGGDHVASISGMMRSVGRACFYTSFTTAIGFLSLLVSDHQAVAGFGLKASMAVGVAFVCVVTVLPLALSLWPLRRRGRGTLPEMKRIASLRGRRVGVVLLVVVIVAALGAWRLKVDSRWLEELPPDDENVVDMHWLEENFSGMISFDLRVTGTLDTPEAVRALEELQTWFLEQDGVSSVESYTGWIREALGNPSELDDTAIRTGIARLRAAGDLFPRHVVRHDFRLARLGFQIEDVGSIRFIELQKAIEERADGLPGDLRARLGGYTVMAHESGIMVIRTMLESFAISALAITLFIMLTFRSWRIALISIPANVVPVLVGLGLAGWVGIELRIGIAMIFSLGIGLAVDDTIHLLVRLQQERERERMRGEAGALRDAIDRAMVGTGTALVLTSTVLVVGALCFLPSSFRSMQDVGVLLSVIVVAALAADLVFLPWLAEKVLGDGAAVRSARTGG